MKYENNKIVYEVGDWVIGQDMDYKDIGSAWQVTEIDINIKYGRNDQHFSIVRLASQEEIYKATEKEKIMVDEYEVEFYKVEGCRPHTIKVGRVKVSEELFKKIGKRAGWLWKKYYTA